MSDFNKKSFYNDVMTHIEEIEALYEEYGFAEEDGYDVNSEEESFDEDLLKTFINHIKDAKTIAEENN